MGNTQRAGGPARAAVDVGHHLASARFNNKKFSKTILKLALKVNLDFIKHIVKKIREREQTCKVCAHTGRN